MKIPIVEVDEEEEVEVENFEPEPEPQLANGLNQTMNIDIPK